MAGETVSRVVEVSAAQLEDLEALHAELRGIPGLVAEATAASVEPGEQGGVLEFLTVACSGGAITVLFQIIKALAESRGPKFSLKVRHGRDRLEVTADNIDEVLPVIRELLNGS